MIFFTCAVVAFFSFGTDQNYMIDNGSMFYLLYTGQLLAYVVSVLVVILLLSADTVTNALLRGSALCPIV